MPHASNSKGSIHHRSLAKQDIVLDLLRNGMQIRQAMADPRVGLSASAFRQWCVRNPKFDAEQKVARAEASRKVNKFDESMTSAEFAYRYFGRQRTAFQQQWIDSIEDMRPGNILLTLWPPEYGKTTTFEDYATEQLCRNPEWRNTTVSENDGISKRIVGRVRRRLEVGGPFPRLIKEWGPFRPDNAGRGDGAPPWNNQFFSVKDKTQGDERDYSMLAIGWTSSIVSIRTDHLHADDLQGLKTLQRTPKLLEIFRQDLLSRPGESGKTTVSGTRVGDDDVYEGLLEDEELDGILEVRRFAAIQFDVDGNPYPLWPEKHSLENLDRIRRKIKDAAFDRNYMMEPGRSKTRFSFDDEGFGRSKMEQYSLNQTGLWVPGTAKPTVVLSLDPGLDPGITCLGGWEMTEDYMRLRYFYETGENVRNEQVIANVQAAARQLSRDFAVRELRVESKNFQRGLARDERLDAVAQSYGFRIAEHDTGLNKYDESIGLASMAGDWKAGYIQLPYADEGDTRKEIDEFYRQFKKWKPDPKTGLVKKGNKVRYDRLMMTWFAWIWWTENRHRLGKPVTPIRRTSMPYSPGRMTPIIPIGARIL